MSLRLEDEPLGYQPSHGPRIAFRLSYRQRGAIDEDAAVFSLGPNWSCSFRACVVDLTTLTPGLVRLHKAGAGWIDYYEGVTQYRDGSILTAQNGGSGFEVVYADGSKEVYTQPYTSAAGLDYYFLSSQSDSAGNTTTYNYSSGGGVQLVSVTDLDGRTTALYYENATFPNLITKVVDPFSRTNLLTYDEGGFLTNIVDVAGLPSSLQYGSGTHRAWITSLTTPYGMTSFSFGGVDQDSPWFYSTGNQVNRFVEVTLPTGGRYLYLYRHDCSGILQNWNPTLPTTSPLPNTFDNTDLYNRNSFHWDPLQYEHLSTTDPTALNASDYFIGHLNHWLLLAPGRTSDALSLERLPSPDGSAEGQVTWYDFEGKTTANNYIGTSALPSFVALVLPDGSTRFTHYARNLHSAITEDISTYSQTDGSVGLRTNTFVFASGDLDLVLHTGPAGEQVVSNYFGNVYHQPDASYDALNQETRYTYSATRQLTSISRPSGLTTTNIYFDSGADAARLKETIDIEIGRTNAYTYYANGLVQTHTDERGLTTSSFGDSLQRLTGTSYPDGTTTSNLYTALDLTASKDRLNYWTCFGHNALGQKTAETNANNVVTRWGYCDCGTLYALTNAWNTPAEAVTTFLYDFQGNRTYVFLPDSSQTNWYNSLRQVVQASDGSALRTCGYNNQGLLTNVSNAYGAERATVFDLEDRPLYLTDANGVTLTNTYDLLGRVLRRSYPDGGIERFGYSARGMTAYTNQLNCVTRFAYDPAGRKNFETNANNELLQFYYDSSGSLTNLVDGKGQSTRWGFNEYGLVTNKLDQTEVEILRYAYDPNGRLTHRWSKAKGNTAYTYDPLGNLTLVDYPGFPDITFQYDWLNRVTNMMDGVGATAYTYTSGGQLLTEDGPFDDDTVTNTYSHRKRTALALQQPIGAWTNGFGWDAAGRLTNVTSPAGRFGYRYTAVAGAFAGGLVQKLSLPTGAYITNYYDSVARLRGTLLRHSGDTTLDAALYGYNAANQRTAYTNTAGTFVQYAYDSIGQLTVVDSSDNREDQGYAYDAAWNLNYRTNGLWPCLFSVDAKNQLTYPTLDYMSIGYDNNGNLTSTAVEDEAGNPIPTAYEYDGENRLVAIQKGYYSGPVWWPVWRTEFQYDGLGRLRVRSEYSGNEWRDWDLTGATLYVYDGWRVIQERGWHVSLARGVEGEQDWRPVSYTRGNDLSGTFEGAGGIGGLLARSDSTAYAPNGYDAYYHADGNGNITCLIGTNQAVVASYRYDPFGNTLSASGVLAGANVYRFSSKEIHGNSGLYYYGHRFYDPELQRWLNRDPLGEPGFEATRWPRPMEFSDGANLYSFVRNDPCDGVDRNGLTLWLCSRKTDFKIGNHVYFWNDSPLPGDNQACGMNASSGKGNPNVPNHPEQGPPRDGHGGDACQPIPETEDPMYVNEVWDCCKKSANTGVYKPWGNDCHDKLDDCLTPYGITPPKHPRLGHPRVFPSTGHRPVFTPLP